jgi:hypothetical protein
MNYSPLGMVAERKPAYNYVVVKRISGGDLYATRPIPWFSGAAHGSVGWRISDVSRGWRLASCPFVACPDFFDRAPVYGTENGVTSSWSGVPARSIQFGNRLGSTTVLARLCCRLLLPARLRSVRQYETHRFDLVNLAAANLEHFPGFQIARPQAFHRQRIQAGHSHNLD